jgi:RNA recognition motif-containing protein
LVDTVEIEPSEIPREDGDRSESQSGRKRSLRTVMRLYVGNLPFSATEDELRELFSKHGAVHGVNLITDRETGRLRGSVSSRWTTPRVRPRFAPPTERSSAGAT